MKRDVKGWLEVCTLGRGGITSFPLHGIGIKVAELVQRQRGERQRLKGGGGEKGEKQFVLLQSVQWIYNRRMN